MRKFYKIIISSISFYLLIFTVFLSSVTQGATIGDRSSPYSGYNKRLLSFQQFSWDEPKKIELQLLQVIRGDQANAIVARENMFNEEPNVDEEWQLYKFHLKYVSGPEEELYAYDVIGDFFTQSGLKIEPISIAAFSRDLEGLGIYDVALYPGAESDVWFGMLVKKSVGYPFYRIPIGYDNSRFETKYAWFSTDPTYSEPIMVIGINLNLTSKTVKVGETFTLVATVLPSNATNKAVTWSTNNSKVATVDGSGKVTARGVGKAVITAKTIDGGYAATCTVTVEPVKVTGIKLNTTSKIIKKGGSFTLVATVMPYNATNKAVVWTTSNTKVAKVYSNGKVVAIGKGVAVITAKTVDGGYRATCKVVVK